MRQSAPCQPLLACRLAAPPPLCLLQALQARFIDYIRGRKTVGLDELAAEFGMRTQEAIKRVQALEAEGALTGVMDDRGKVGAGLGGEGLGGQGKVSRQGRAGLAGMCVWCVHGRLDCRLAGWA